MQNQILGRPRWPVNHSQLPRWQNQVSECSMHSVQTRLWQPNGQTRLRQPNGPLKIPSREHWGKVCQPQESLLFPPSFLQEDKWQKKVYGIPQGQGKWPVGQKHHYVEKTFLTKEEHAMQKVLTEVNSSHLHHGGATTHSLNSHWPVQGPAHWSIVQQSHSVNQSYSVNQNPSVSPPFFLKVRECIHWWENAKASKEVLNLIWEGVQLTYPITGNLSMKVCKRNLEETSLAMD